MVPLLPIINTNFSLICLLIRNLKRNEKIPLVYSHSKVLPNTLRQYPGKTLPPRKFLTTFCFRLLSKTKFRKNVASWVIGTVMFWKSFGEMVRFSTKPDYQTDKNESSNLVNKTRLVKRWVPRLSLFYFYKMFPWRLTKSDLV